MITNYERVMIPAKPRANREIAEPYRILSPQRLFSIQPMIEEVERDRRAWIEEGRVRDVVLQGFSDRRINRVAAHLDVMPVFVQSNAGVQVAAAKSPLLRGNDRSSKPIRPEIGGKILDYGSHVQQKFG